jgi:hypothetical protein
MRQDRLRALFLIGHHSRISIQRHRQRPVRVKHIQTARTRRNFMHSHSGQKKEKLKAENLKLKWGS